MKKAAIAIDSRKLPIFEEMLEAEGYEYTNTGEPVDGIIILSVMVRDKDVGKLANLVQRMSIKAARSRGH